ncbi:hypothetical protein [Methanobrevibacter arboriphilus]|nr:hypothetical protein [Methanobrevibacter arboriphilus]
MGIKTTIKAAAGNINNALFKKQSKDTYTKEQGELDFLYDEDYNKKKIL